MYISLFLGQRGYLDYDDGLELLGLLDYCVGLMLLGLLDYAGLMLLGQCY